MARQGKEIGVFSAIWPPLLLAIVSFPLAFGLIGPNSFYGVRTAETLSSMETWYRANLNAGWVGLVFGAIACFANLRIVQSSKLQAKKKIWFTLSSTLLAVTAMVAAGLLAI